MKVRRVLALLVAMLLTALPALAVTTLDPTEDFYVNDAAGVFTDEAMGHIILNNDVLYDACGAQIVFVTIDEVSSTTMENYCYSLGNSWEVGGKERNGIVVLMSINDDDYLAMQGTGLQDYITSGDLDEMLYTYLEPCFAKKQYAQGAVALFDKLFEAVADVYKLDIRPDHTLYDKYIAQFDNYDGNYYTNRNSHPENDTFSTILGAIILLVIVLIIVNSRRRRYRGVYVAPRPRFFYTPRPPRRPYGGRPMGGSRPSGGFGGSRPSGGFSSSRSSGGFSSSRSSGSFGGGRSGGGGSFRGGGAGRHR